MKKKTPQITVNVNFFSIKIMIGTLVYVWIKRDEFVGFQAWIEGGGKWVIEFNTKSTSILTEQNSKEKWEAIINELNNKL